MSKRTQLECHSMKALMAELRKEPSELPTALTWGVWEVICGCSSYKSWPFGPNSWSFRNGSEEP